MSIIILDSVIRSGEKYYPQTYLEECKYKQQQQKQQQQQQQQQWQKKNYIDISDNDE